jgi:DNA repair protein RecO
VKARVKDQAFLIKSSPYSDSSLILKAFGRDHGLLSLLAKGIRSKPEASLLNPLYLYEFSFYEPREAGLCLLAEFSLAEEFDFTDRIEVWTAAECALELYAQLIIPTEESAAYFALLRDYLVYLGTLETNAVLIWWRFLLRVFRMLGIPCDACLCSACGSTTLSAWERGSGRVLCAGCRDALPDPRRCEPLSSVSARVLNLLPVIGEHLATLKLDRNCVASLNDLFAQHYQAHFHKALKLRGLEVLEQFYA